MVGVSRLLGWLVLGACIMLLAVGAIGQMVRSADAEVPPLNVGRIVEVLPDGSERVVWEGPLESLPTPVPDPPTPSASPPTTPVPSTPPPDSPSSSSGTD